jgi:threonine/homoserine/homoserine lactone efflux protein
LTAPATHGAQAVRNPGRLVAYVSTLGLTLTNPATILSFTAVFVGLRLGETAGNYYAAGSVVLGVFPGSASWWLFLSTLVGFFRERFTPAWMLWVNRLAGAVILGFGIAVLVLR